MMIKQTIQRNASSTWRVKVGTPQPLQLLNRKIIWAKHPNLIPISKPHKLLLKRLVSIFQSMMRTTQQEPVFILSSNGFLLVALKFKSVLSKGCCDMSKNLAMVVSKLCLCLRQFAVCSSIHLRQRLFSEKTIVSYLLKRLHSATWKVQIFQSNSPLLTKAVTTCS